MTTHQGHADSDSNNLANSITDSYEELLFEQLQDSERAIGYLNAALGDPDPRVFSLALQDVVKSRSLPEVQINTTPVG
ncbi:MAG: hypothetical protein SNJ68_00080 [Cyanobacteriota bacterium]